MQQKGVSVVFHYVDDFITLEAPRSAECSSNNVIMHETCEHLGLSPEPEKDEGPDTAISFTGTEIDSIAMELKLPAEKLSRLKAELGYWRKRRACKKRELLSLLGLLAHASKVVRAGRTFVRRLIDLSTTAKRLDHFVRLSTEARSDIEWWWRFCETWNGVRVLLGHPEARVSKVVATDASGSWGYGACWSNHWFRMQWQEEMQESHITYKELVPIVLAVTVWGRQWRNATIQVLCDNEAVVAIVNQGTGDKECMHLLRCLAFLKARFNIEIVSTHIAGKTNISRCTFKECNVKVSYVACAGGSNTHGDPGGGVRRAAGSETRPDITGMGRAVEFCFQQGLADNTKKAYASAQKKHLSFCTDTHLHPLSVKEHILCRFATRLVEEGLAHSSIKCYLAGVRQLHLAGGWKDPEICQMARLVQVLRGIRAVQAKRGGSISRLRLPITTDQKLKTVWVRGDNPQEGRMLWAAAALCFFGFFRLGEITVPSAEAFDMGAHLSFQDILVDNITKPRALRVRLKASKTDPFRKGLDVHIRHTQDELCPVSAVLTFMVARGPGAGPFFRY